MKNTDYSILEYDLKVVENFPLSFQPYYVDYVNASLNGEIRLFETNGVYICFIVRKKFGFPFVHLISELFTVENSEIDTTTFFHHLAYYFRLIRVISVFPPQHLHTYKEAPKGAKSYSLGIIQLDLVPSKDSIYMNFKSVYRRHIKSAQKEGVHVEFGLHLFDEFYTFYESRMQSNNAVYDSKSTLKKIIETAPENVLCAVARLNGSIEAVILNIHDTTTAYYMWGASGINSHNGSFRLLHWELIQKYLSKGIQHYSLGGYRFDEFKTKKQENLENFKLGFGAQIINGVHFNWVLQPFHYYLYQKISQLFHLLRR